MTRAGEAPTCSASQWRGLPVEVGGAVGLPGASTGTSRAAKIESRYASTPSAAASGRRRDSGRHSGWLAARHSTASPARGGEGGEPTRRRGQRCAAVRPEPLPAAVVGVPPGGWSVHDRPPTGHGLEHHDLETARREVLGRTQAREAAAERPPRHMPSIRPSVLPPSHRPSRAIESETLTPGPDSWAPPGRSDRGVPAGRYDHRVSSAPPTMATSPAGRVTSPQREAVTDPGPYSACCRGRGRQDAGPGRCVWPAGSMTPAPSPSTSWWRPSAARRRPSCAAGSTASRWAASRPARSTASPSSLILRSAPIDGPRRRRCSLTGARSSPGCRRQQRESPGRGRSCGAPTPLVRVNRA